MATPIIKVEDDPKKGSYIGQLEQAGAGDPNSIIQGAKVGETAGGIPATDITRQFMIQNNPVADFVPKASSNGVLSSSPAREFQNNVKSDLDLKQENLAKEAESISGILGNGTRQYDPKNFQFDTINPATGKEDARLASLQANAEKNGWSENVVRQQYAQIYNQMAIEERNRPNKERLDEGQKNEAGSARVAEFRGGRTGTDYAKDVLSDLQTEHARQQTEFGNAQQDLVNQMNNNILRGYAKRESDILGRTSDLYKQYNEIETEKIKQKEDYQKQYKEVLEIQKMERQMGREAEEDAGRLIDRFATLGAEPTDVQLGYVDERYGLPQGTSSLMYGVAKLEQDKLQAKTVDEKRSNAIESASKLVTLLDKVPIGQSVTINGVEYSGQSRGALKSGTETDDKGNVTFWEYNQDTQETRKTSLGNIGKKEDGWQTLNLGDEGVWRVNDSTGQAVPFYPGEATTSWSEAYPEGTIGPVLPGNPAAAGQCGAACNYFYGERIWGDSIEQKTQEMKKRGEIPKNQVEVKDSLVMKVGSTGHVAIVNQVSVGPDGKRVFRFTESNIKGDGKMTHDRTMKEDDPRIVGFTRIPTPNLPNAGPDASKPIRNVLGASSPEDTSSSTGALAESLINGEITIADVPAAERGSVLAVQKTLVKKRDEKDRTDFERDYQNELSMSVSPAILESAWLKYKGQRDTASTGKLSPESIAANIMSGVSSIRVNELPTGQRAKVDAELTRLKTEAKETGDTISELRASAGGKDTAESFNTSFDKGMGVLQQIEELQRLIGSEETGPITGLIRSNNPYDVKAREMKSLLTSIIPNLARGVYGEVGVLTDNDVALYAKTLPNMTDTAAANKLILSATIRGVGRSLERKLKTQASANRDVSGFVDEYLELLDRSNGLLAESDPDNYRVYEGALYTKQGNNWVVQN